MSWLGRLPVYLFLVFLLLKLCEMAKCVCWVIRVDDIFISKFRSSLVHGIQKPENILHRHRFPFFPGNTRLTRWIKQSPYSFRSFVFRYPNLMLIMAALTFLMGHLGLPEISKPERYMLAGILLFGVWVKAIHLLVYRYKFGAIDNLMQSLSIPQMSQQIDLELPELRGVRNFVRVFSSTILVAIFSYAAVYYNVAKIASGSLHGIDWMQPLWIQTLYFSATTFCTVGFGDIYPAHYGLKLITTSEMVLSLALLVLFITAFSSTASLTETKSR